MTKVTITISMTHSELDVTKNVLYDYALLMPSSISRLSVRVKSLLRKRVTRTSKISSQKESQTGIVIIQTIV